MFTTVYQEEDVSEKTKEEICQLLEENGMEKSEEARSEVPEEPWEEPEEPDEPWEEEEDRDEEGEPGTEEFDEEEDDATEHTEL